MARRLEVEENFLDRVIKFVDPVKAARRYQARAALAVAGGYTGGSRSRRSLSTFTPHGDSADAALLPDLDILRARSRDLCRNSPLAGGAVSTVVTSVVGPGLTLKSSIYRDYLGLTDKEADAWEAEAERLWCAWSESSECDATRTQTFAELQELVFRATLESGDVFTLLPYIERHGSPFGLKIKVIEADRISNKGGAMDTPKQAGGVELDEHGAPKAYHILRGHPGDLNRISREWDVVPAFGASTGRRNVLHHFNRRRPGQTRGIPYLAPVIESLKQISDYTEAELMAAVVSGMFTVFIKTEDGDANLGVMAPSSETGGSASDEDYKLANGAIVGLARGESIETANPGRPNAAFDPFVTSILRQIGVGLEIPYELLIKHFQSSYTAARAAMMEAWRAFKMRRAWLVGSFNQPVYEAFLYEMVARGALPAPGFLDDPLVRHAYCGALWNGRPMGHMQPLQEANAIAARIEAGISNREIETAEYSGNDWEDVHQQAAKEQKMREADGLNPAPASPFGAPNAPAGPPAPADTDDAPDDEQDDAKKKQQEEESGDQPGEQSRNVNITIESDSGMVSTGLVRDKLTSALADKKPKK